MVLGKLEAIMVEISQSSTGVNDGSYRLYVKRDMISYVVQCS